MATVQGIPATIRAGDTTIFKISNSSYPNTDWFYDFVISRRGRAIAKIRATEEGTAFLVTIGTDISSVAGFTPGRATFYERFTAKVGGQTETPSSGILTILPDPTKDIPQTSNQLALASCTEALQNLVDGGENMTVNFAGQSFTRRDMKDLMDARDRIQVLVDNELRAMGADDRSGSGYKPIRFRFR